MVDELADRLGCRLRRRGRMEARAVQATWAGEPLWLVKPEGFMNNSGPVVAALLGQQGLAATDLVVVLDDADLPLGRLRIRPRGGSGGHKGLSSIVAHVGTDEFARIRLGIGRGAGTTDLVTHVLSAFTADEWSAMQKVFVRAADAVEAVLTSGVDEAMNRFNAKGPDADAAEVPGAGGMQ